jgi:hypothetical protein
VPSIYVHNAQQKELLKDYSANPYVKLNNSVAIKSSHTKPPNQPFVWPEKIKPGAWVKWAERDGRGQNVARIKQGRVMSVEQKSARIYTGKYSETINLVDLYIGEVKIL